MDYRMQITVVIDTEGKKNTFRDSIISNLESQYTSGNVKIWDMSISGIIIPEEDSESYNSPT